MLHRIKEEWIFNLESMHDKLWCLIYDFENEKLQFPITVANTVCNDIEDIEALIEECENLEWLAKSCKVCDDDFKRIAEIVGWRIAVRNGREIK